MSNFVYFGLVFLCAFVGTYLGNCLWERRQIKLFPDDKIGLIADESYTKPRNKAEFLPEATQTELEEMVQPSWLKKVVSGVVKILK